MHKAFIAKIDKVQDIPNADRIHIAYVLGESVVVSKDWGVGKVGVFFQEGLQLSEEFCSENNLFRHSNKNKDNTKKGFFDDNRRVRAQPFLKQKSEGFFTTVESLSYTGVDLDSFKVSDSFDKLEGKEICKKYISEQTKKAMNHVQKKKTKMKDTPMFNKHVNTEQFRHYAHSIPKGALLSFHAKVHGTSARMSYSKVVKNLPKWKQVINNYLPVFSTESWEYLTGTRNVVLFEDQYDKEGFHGSEQFRFDVMEMVKPYLIKGMTVYGEIAGFANGKPIMGTHSTDTLKDKKFKKKYGEQTTYTYGCKEHELRFHIYRISLTNEDGFEQDFTAQQITDWCEQRGLLAHLDVHPQMIYDGDVDKLTNLVEHLTERPDVMTEDYIDPSHISEGIIIRVDHGTNTPKFYKNKSYAFKVMEGIFKETNIDLEDAS